jgi:hypothetical protein
VYVLACQAVLRLVGAAALAVFVRRFREVVAVQRPVEAVRHGSTDTVLN